MPEAPRWRIGVEARSADVGAAAAFADAVDYDDVQPFPVPGMVLVLGSWIWQDGRETAWWLGAIVEAQSAADAAQRVTSVVAARTSGVDTLAMTLDVTASTAHSTEELVAEEEVALHAIPGSAAPYIVPIRARAHARRGERLTVEWTTSGDYELAHVTVAVADFLTIGLFEHRSPLTGPNVEGDPMILKSRHVVLDLGDVPLGLRYSGERVPEGDDHPVLSAPTPAHLVPRTRRQERRSHQLASSGWWSRRATVRQAVPALRGRVDTARRRLAAGAVAGRPGRAARATARRH